jgi:hypothetical protein
VIPVLVTTSRSGQCWDITYIRLLREFIYLAVILDAFSRRVIGWALERTLETELALITLCSNSALVRMIVVTNLSAVEQLNIPDKE